MLRTIGILAPFLASETQESDFVIRIKHNKREFTLSCIRELMSNNYSFEKIKKKEDYFDTFIPAAGYYLSSVLRKNRYNTMVSQKIDDTTLTYFSANNPYAICISSTMIMQKETLKTVIHRVREFFPDILIIVGGVFIWKSYIHYNSFQNKNKQEYNDYKPWGVFPCNKQEINADILIVDNHGISSLLNVLSENEKGSKADFGHIPNIAIPDNKGPFYFTKRKRESEVFINDYPQWDILDTLPAKIPIRTSTGCAYRCRFCDFCQIYPRVYIRDKSSILDELKLIKKLINKRNTIALLHLTDDNVFINDKRTREICQTIIDSRINMYWTCFTRADSIKETNIKLMKESRLIHTMIGIESADNDQLVRINKMQNKDAMKKGIELLDKAGISVNLTFLIGFPGENETTINNTAEFLNNLDLKECLVHYQLYPFMLLPLSEISKPENRDKWKLKGLFNNWSHQTMSSIMINQVSYDLFKKVNSLPYNYWDESNIDIFRFQKGQRKKIFELRNRLTIQLIEKDSWNRITHTFNAMAKIMGLPERCPGHDFRHNLVINYHMNL